jgi:DNA-directed RNA polymerase specialized sigma24 family protein
VKGHYFEGIKLAELADRMGMSSVAMRQLLHRVRVLLLECVRRRLSVENPS